MASPCDQTALNSVQTHVPKGKVRLGFTCKTYVNSVQTHVPEGKVTQHLAQHGWMPSRCAAPFWLQHDSTAPHSLAVCEKQGELEQCWASHGPREIRKMRKYPPTLSSGSSGYLGTSATLREGKEWWEQAGTILPRDDKQPSEAIQGINRKKSA